MKRPIIAVDIDDVLAAEAEYVIDYSNAKWGHNLSIDDYTEHWSFWGVDDEEFERRAEELHLPGTVSKYRLIPSALEVLQKLKNKYSLVVLTSRRNRVQDETVHWLSTHFKEVFDDVKFTGFWDDPSRKDRHLLSKGKLLSEMGVEYLIDDQPKHCIGASEHGVKAIMFGDYATTRDVKVPQGVIRCKNWQEVAEYFGV